MPQSTLTPSSLTLKSGNSEKALSTDPFSTQSWMASQRAYAEQHPSYAQRVVPELMRPRDPLESYPLERLQYVGQIASGAEIEALVQVLPHLAAKKEVPMASVHRVRVGAYLGQDFGRVQSVASERLVLQELVLTPTGEWQPREVNLPLKESVP
jgi:Tfp pilus assembly protein PilP